MRPPLLFKLISVSVQCSSVDALVFKIDEGYDFLYSSLLITTLKVLIYEV